MNTIPGDELQAILRRAVESDSEGAASLFSELGGILPVPLGDEGMRHWRSLLDHPGTTVFVAEIQAVLASIAVLHILPNMTNMARPYALIENVVTSAGYRGKGLGRLVMEAAINHAWQQNAYKIMLVTGKNRKDGGVLGFYERLGFTSNKKHALTMRCVPERD